MAIDISVVIATYKRPDLLLACLQTLLNQTFPWDRFEVVVVTDGTDEATVQKVAQQPIQMLNLRLLSLPKKGGPAAARNLGWRSAKGEIILFTDDDCLASPYWLADYWHAYASNAQPNIAFTGKVKVPVSRPPTDYEKNVALLEKASFITANCACTKSALQLVNGFDEDFQMAWREDSQLEFDLRSHQVPIIALPNAIVTHPVRKAGWGVSLREQKKSMYNVLLFKKHPQLYRSEINCKPPWFYYAIVFSPLLALALLPFAPMFALACLFVCLGLIAGFCFKRLRNTSKSLSHISEMAVTSVLIPFLSVYWTCYGTIKFKSLYR